MTDRELLELLVKKVTDIDNRQRQDRDTLEIIAVQVGKLTQDVDEVKSELSGVKSDLNGVKSELSEVKKTVTKIEHEHGQKLEALFDGWKQNSQQLERIENEVSRHEEVILRKIK